MSDALLALLRKLTEAGVLTFVKRFEARDAIELDRLMRVVETEARAEMDSRG